MAASGTAFHAERKALREAKEREKREAEEAAERAEAADRYGFDVEAY